MRFIRLIHRNRFDKYVLERASGQLAHGGRERRRQHVRAAALGRQITRARQMSSQYHFLYDRAGPLGWRERA